MNFLWKRNQCLPPLGQIICARCIAAGLLGQRFFKVNSKWRTKFHSRLTLVSKMRVHSIILLAYAPLVHLPWCTLIAPHPHPHPPPPNILHKHCVHFSWNGCNTQEKWETKVTQNLGWGAQIRCITGDVQVACTRIFSRLIFLRLISISMRSFYSYSYLATLVSPQNCTKMLSDLTFVVQFAYCHERY